MTGSSSTPDKKMGNLTYNSLRENVAETVGKRGRDYTAVTGHPYFGKLSSESKPVKERKFPATAVVIASSLLSMFVSLTSLMVFDWSIWLAILAYLGFAFLFFSGFLTMHYTASR